MSFNFIPEGDNLCIMLCLPLFQLLLKLVSALDRLESIPKMQIFPWGSFEFPDFSFFLLEKFFAFQKFLLSVFILSDVDINSLLQQIQLSFLLIVKAVPFELLPLLFYSLLNVTMLIAHRSSQLFYPRLSHLWPSHLRESGIWALVVIRKRQTILNLFLNRLGLHELFVFLNFEKLGSLLLKYVWFVVDYWFIIADSWFFVFGLANADPGRQIGWQFLELIHRVNATVEKSWSFDETLFSRAVRLVLISHFL